MTIYQIQNQISFKPDYVSDDSAIVLANVKNTAINSIIKGNADTATSILETNQQAYLTQQSFRIAVNKVIVDENNNSVQSGVDLTAEPTNEVQEYNVFNDLTGTWSVVTGTDALHAAVASYNQQLLDAAGLSSYTIVTAVPQPPAQPKSTGTKSV